MYESPVEKLLSSVLFSPRNWAHSSIRTCSGLLDAHVLLHIEFSISLHIGTMFCFFVLFLLCKRDFGETGY